MLLSTPSALLALLGTWCFTLVVQPSWAEVDTSSPDLRIYNLGRVGDKRLAKQRAGQRIDDLATGALHMHESLFVTANTIKCPAYAQLFKLIKQQNNSPSSDSSKAIRQNVVESLAVVVTYDRVVYHKMFLESVKLGEAADNFAEAVEALESSKDVHARDVWLDLIECISEYMLGSGGSSRAVDLMSDSRRSQAIEAANFKAIALPIDSDRPPAGIAKGLVNKFDGMAKAGDMHVSAFKYEQARKLTDLIEGADIAEMKQRIMAEPELPERQPESQPEKQPEVHSEPTISADKVQPKEDEPASCVNGICAYQLDILEFIKMRLEMKPARRFETVPLLSLQLALDFQSHWEDLEKAQLNANTKLGRRALQFREDPVNENLAKRVAAAISEYVKIVSKIAEIRMQGDRIKDLASLRQSIVELGEHLSKIDSSFDIDDLRRVHELWKRKYNNLHVVENFINTDSW